MNPVSDLWAVNPVKASSLRVIFQRVGSPGQTVPAPRTAAYGTTPIGVPGPAYWTQMVGARRVGVLAVGGFLTKDWLWWGGTSNAWARRQLKSAARDPWVEAIMLAIDSPGGPVAGVDELAAEVRAAGKAKPVHAFVEDECVGTAYWVASQAARVTVNSAAALLGGVGTVSVLYDLSAMAEKQGVRTHVISTGEHKGAGAPGSKITNAQAEPFQRRAEQTQAVFDAAVTAGRRLKAEDLERVKHGGMMLTAEAAFCKLIDDVQPFDAALEALARAVGK